MGNQSIKDYNDYNWEETPKPAVEANNINCKSKRKILEPENRKLLRTKRKAKIKPISNRSPRISAPCFEFQRNHTMFGDNVPVVLTLLTDSYRLRLDNKPINHFCPQLNIALPCHQEWQRLISNLCTTCCRKCRKSFNKRKKQRR